MEVIVEKEGREGEFRVGGHDRGGVGVTVSWERLAEILADSGRVSINRDEWIAKMIFNDYGVTLRYERDAG